MAAYLGYTLRMKTLLLADQLWLMTRIREEVALVKLHQALELYVSLAITMDRYTVCRSLSSMP